VLSYTDSCIRKYTNAFTFCQNPPRRLPQVSRNGLIGIWAERSRRKIPHSEKGACRKYEHSGGLGEFDFLAYSQNLHTVLSPVIIPLTIHVGIE
jgi:hypothetical protein